MGEYCFGERHEENKAMLLVLRDINSVTRSVNCIYIIFYLF